MNIDPNAAAFPLDAEQFYAGIGPGQGWVRGVKSPGVSIRAHFAAMAMQGLLSSADGWEERGDIIAAIAVEQADALIEALSK